MAQKSTFTVNSYSKISLQISHRQVQNKVIFSTIAFHRSQDHKAFTQNLNAKVLNLQDSGA